MGIPGLSLFIIKQSLHYSNMAYNGPSFFKGGKMLFQGTAHGVSIPVYYGYQYGNDLYVSIKGTNDEDDFTTDARYREVKQCFGNDCLYFHGGFYKAAKYMYGNIKQNLKDFNNGNIYFTGHSMGASVATILGMMVLNDPELRDKNIGVIAIAPAPCVNYIPARFSDKIINIVNKNDIIPTFSISNLYNTIKPLVPKHSATQYIFRSVLNTILRVFKTIKSDFSLKLFNALNQCMNEIVSDLYAFKEGTPAQYIRTLKGKTYLLSSDSPTALFKCEIRPETLDKMSISPNSINAHMPNEYNAGMARITSL